MAWGTATLWGREWWQRVELGADGETPHDMGLLRQLPAIVLGGIATVRQAPDGAPGQLLGDAIEDSTGQLTARTIRHIEGGGLGWFEIQFEANRDAEAVAGPTLEGDVHDPQNDVQAPQRPVFLPCGAGAMTVAGEPFDMAPGFFLRGIVEAAPHDLAFWDQLGCQADDRPPEVPALVVEGAPEEDREA